jgi:hypothetical protein
MMEGAALVVSWSGIGGAMDRVPQLYKIINIHQCVGVASVE